MILDIREDASDEGLSIKAYCATRDARMQRKSCPGRNVFGLTAPLRRVLWFGFAVFVAGAILVAGLNCGPKSTKTSRPGGDFEGMVVRVACSGEPVSRVISTFGRRWASNVGASVEVVPYGPATASQDDLPGDLWVIPPAEMPFWAAGNKLHVVPDSYTARSGAYAWEGILPLYRNKLLLWDEKAYALPLLGDAFLCFYRKDLFDDPQHQAAFKRKYKHNLAAPETWEQFTDIADYFQGQKRPGIDHLCPSLPPLPASDTELDREFYLLAAPIARRAVREDERQPVSDVELFSFHYDVDTGGVRIDTGGFVKALESLQKLQAYRPAETSAEPPLSFQSGEAVLCLASPSWITRFNENPRVRGKFGICPVPGSGYVCNYRFGDTEGIPGGNHVPYLGAGGWVAVVPRTNSQPEAAFALAAALSDVQTSCDVVIEPACGGGVFRREHLQGQLGWRAFGLGDASSTEHLVEILSDVALHPQVKDPVMRLRIPQERTHREALDVQIRIALGHGKSAVDALKAAEQSWRKLDSGIDLKERISNYRLSLGLGR